MRIEKAKFEEFIKRAASRDCVIKPAQPYSAVDDLCILTCYFNPCGYSNLLNNYLAFRQSIVGSGLTLITVECAFNGAPFHLPPEENIIPVRSDSIIWQKECLLNVALQAAKRKFTKVAWLDADIFFADPEWAVRASSALDQCQIVQPFSDIALLAPGMTHYEGSDLLTHGIASVLDSDFTLISEAYDLHGHTGYAWAARTDALPDGFFDGCLLGCGDHVMAHAMFGDIESECIKATFFNDPASLQYFERWAIAFFSRVQSSVGFCQGTILPRWHGNKGNRNYLKAAQKLARFGVNPDTDLRKNSDACWEWNSNRPSLHKYVASYFVSRKEDEQ